MSAYVTIGREVGFGELMSRTFANLWLIWPQVLAYLAVFALLGLAMPLFGSERAGLADFLLYFAGQYWLFRTVLRKRGLLQTQRIHFFAFVGLALLLILPIAIGFALLIVPGLFLVARWIAAPAFIVAQGHGAFMAAGASEAAVRWQAGKLMKAVVVLFLILVAILMPAAGIDRALGGLADPDALDRLVGHVFPLMLLGLSVSTYELMGSKGTMIEDVFG